MSSKKLRKVRIDPKYGLALGVAAFALTLVLMGTAIGHNTRFSTPLTAHVANNLAMPTGLPTPLPSHAQLHNGRALLHTENALIVTRTIKFTAADIDGDSDSDAAILLQNELHPADAIPENAPAADDATVPRQLTLVVLRNDGGTPIALPAQPIATDVLVDKLSLTPAKLNPRHGAAPPNVQVVFRSRSNPTLAHDTLNTARWSVGKRALVADAHTSESAPAPDQNPALRSVVDGNTGSAQRSGVIGFRQTQTFRLSGLPHQHVNATLVSGDVTLGLHGADGTTLVDPKSRQQHLSVELPHNQTYFLTVQARSATPTRFDIATDISAPALNGPPPGLITTEKVLHLTFDDGPNATNTPAILALLARYHANATFFMLGKNAEANPALVQQVADEGHVIANHSFTHTSMKNMPNDKWDWEVGHTQDLLGPNGSACVRPPYGAMDENTRARAANRGMHTVLWDIDTLDWKKPGSDAIANTVITNARPGAVVLMHDGGGDRTQTVAALERILRELTAQGWRFSALCG